MGCGDERAVRHSRFSHLRGEVSREPRGAPASQSVCTLLGDCIMGGFGWSAILIGSISIIALVLMVVSSARGWFKELPPSRTSEGMEEL